MAPISYLSVGQNSNEFSIEARFQDFESMNRFMKKELTSIGGLRIKGYALVPRFVQNIESWFPPEEIFHD